MKAKIFRSNGRSVGCWLEDGVLHRVARASKHLWRRPPAWAFEVDILNLAEQRGTTTVCVHDLDTGTTYTTALATIRERGFRLPNYGHGDQLALPLSAWKKAPASQLRLF